MAVRRESRSPSRIALALGMAIMACGSDRGGSANDDTGEGGGDASTPTTSSSTDDPSATSTTTGGGESTITGSGGTVTDGSGSIATDGSSDTTTDGTTTAGGCASVGCAGDFTVECADGVDNDGDGPIDLLDPECTSPCDEDEGSFQSTNLGNFTCTWECGFDGNPGMGDDMCHFELECDSENPGANLGCAYDPQRVCEPVVASDQCLATCEPLVPPGCDCYGCCTIATEDGEANVFLEGHWDCSMSNLEACTSCTPRIDECGNPCSPEACEMCIGQSEPPEGCETNACDAGEPCASDADCPCEHYCLLGCCYPPHPG